MSCSRCWGMFMGAALAAGAIGCASLRERKTVEIAPGANMARYQVFGVLPFSDDGGGRGKALAEELCKGLRARGLRTVDMALMEREFGRIKPDAFGMTLYEMSMMRQATKAEVLVSGWVTAQGFSMLALDAESGEELIKAKFGPRPQGYETSEMLSVVLGLLAAGVPGEGALE